MTHRTFHSITRRLFRGVLHFGILPSLLICILLTGCHPPEDEKPTFAVGGVVTGLSGSGLVLQNNTGDNIPISANGSFTFPAGIASGAGYSATVFSQPVLPSQICTVTNGTGPVVGAHITQIAISCVNLFTVGGSVTGLSGAGLVLQNNGGDKIPMGADGNFRFSAGIASGVGYSATVFSQPVLPSQTCTVTNGTGIMANMSVSNLNVQCVTNTYTISGTVTGLLGAGLILRNNGRDDLAISANGIFTFTTAIASGTGYNVSLFVQPSLPDQTCTITNGVGPVVNIDISDVQVICVSPFVAQAYLKAPNAEANDNFGNSVAVSGDTVVVGALFEDSNQTTITNGPTASADNSALEAGAVYVFRRTGTLWVQEAYLKAPNAEAGDHFGWSVAISGDTIAVGAVGESSNQTTITNGPTASTDNSATSAGAVYVFRRNGTIWTQEAYLKAPNAEAGDRFGDSVAIFDDTVVVGPFGESSNQTTITNGPTASTDNSATFSGAVYVFRRTGTTWAQEAYLKAPNAEAQDLFGDSVAISDNTIAVGASWESSNQTSITNGPTASTNNSATSAGAVYVFRRSGTLWTQEAYLKAPNAGARDWFGDSVAISGDTIVVGALWEDSNQTTITNGPTASKNNGASDSGAVYVFRRSGTTWAQEAYLKAPNAEARDGFGYRVAVSSDRIAVGASWESSNQTTITNGPTASADNSATNAGAVYVFRRTGTTWAQEAYLKAPNAEAQDLFGDSVAISGDTIVVGASWEDSSQTTITNGPTASADNSAPYAGAVYIFVGQ